VITEFGTPVDSAIRSASCDISRSGWKNAVSAALAICSLCFAVYGSECDCYSAFLLGRREKGPMDLMNYSPRAWF
jgi:hypothetical protein